MAILVVWSHVVAWIRSYGSCIDWGSSHRTSNLEVQCKDEMIKSTDRAAMRNERWLDNMIDQDQSRAVDVVEQLWYTWSDVGLDTLRAGARIRAASDGLRDIRSVRVQSLDRYLGYSLPPGADPAIPIPAAPVCLSLIATEHERILVHKVYTGRDGVGRYGAFFVHLLAGLPEQFSAYNAISLWQSKLWQRCDVPPDRDIPLSRQTHLERLPLEVLWGESKELTPGAKSNASIRNFLPYLIEAYLTKKPVIEPKTKKKVPQKIYLAGPDNEIAQLIFALTCCLPAQLLKDLTFSTYEPNIHGATTEIIGTCWLSLPEAEKDPHAQRLLLEEHHQQKLTLNCYTGRCTELQGNPLVEHRPLVVKFAHDATIYFLREGSQEFRDNFLMLLDIASSSDRDELLTLYESLIIQGETPIKFLLLSSDYRYIAKNLIKPVYQKSFISLVMYDMDWWRGTGSAAIIKLCQASPKVPRLAEGLREIAHIAIAKCGAVVRQEVLLPRSLPTSEMAAYEESVFKTLLDVIACAVPPVIDATVWTGLLNELLTCKNIFIFLQRHWNIYADLMLLWSSLLSSPEDIKLIRPLLFVSWNTFGEFLTLRLPIEWNQEATKRLAFDNTARLSQEKARELAENYHPLMIDLFQLLVQFPQWWPTTGKLFERLVEGNYPQKMSLLFIMLDSAMMQQQNDVARLLVRALTTADEQAYFLERYGPLYLPLNNTLSKIALGMFSALAKSSDSAAQQQKKRVLASWLRSPQLATWFDLPSRAGRNIASVLELANFTVPERAEFFQYHGQDYIVRDPTAPWLLNFFDVYARDEEARRLYYVSLWLNQGLDQVTLERVLKAARLTTQEKITVLERYGEHYLSQYWNSQILRDYVQEFLTCLYIVGLDIFKKTASPEEPSAAEKFLAFLYNSGRFPALLPQLHDWYFTAVLVRRPVLLKQGRREFVESVGRILQAPALSRETYCGLLEMLAIICLQHQQELDGTIVMMRQALAPSELMYLIGEVAERARGGVQRKLYKNALLGACILFAFHFQHAFYEKSEQDYFVQSFLAALLQGADQKALNWLNAQAKQWPPAISTQWKSYISQAPISTTEPSPIEQVELWWERTVALYKMRFALRSNNFKRIARVADEEMTTLTSDDARVPEEWWHRINEAISTLNTYEEISRRPGTVPKRQGWIKQRWQRLVAFTLIGLAIRSQRVGRIVRVVTDQVNIVERYQANVPPQWWRQIDAAFDFFLACEDADEGPDEKREAAIVAAGEKLSALYEAKHPAPVLTCHEIKRAKAARFYMDSQMKGTLKGWVPVTLLPPDTGENKNFSPR